MPKLGSFGTGSTKGSGLQGYTFPAPTGQFTQTLPGTYTWTAPANVKKVDIVMVGGGGGGGGAGRNSGGGGGASLTYANDVTVIPGTTYSYKVGAGGAVNTDGEASWFNNSTYLFANGGSKGTKTDSDATDQVTFTTASTGTDVPAVNGGNVVSDGTMGVYRQCTWTCPEGVFSISVVCVGAGGGGSPPTGISQGTTGGSGGQGGTLSYKNNISVTPGVVYTLQVGKTTTPSTTSVTSFTSNSGLGGTIGGDTCLYDIIGLTVTQTAANGNITISDASRLVVNAAIMFAGTLGNIINGKKYLITSVNTSTNIITVTDRWNGATLTWTPVTGSMAAVATSILASGGVGASGASSNITLSGGGFKLGDGGGFGGLGGTTSNSLSAGGGGAGGYSGNGGVGGSAAGSLPGAGPTRGAGGAAITSSGAAGGGSSGNMITIIVNAQTTSTPSQIVGNGITTVTISVTTAVIVAAMVGGQVKSANDTILGTIISNSSTTSFTIVLLVTISGSTNIVITYRTNRTASGGGGGVGILGIGIDGVATSTPPATPTGAFATYGGNPGSPTALAATGGTAATSLATATSSGPAAGNYGGGGGGTTASNTTNYAGGASSDGALRIIYGVNRSFPLAAGTVTASAYSTATAYAGGGGGGAAGYSSNGGAGGTAISGAAGGAGGVAFSGTIAGATIVSYVGGLGGIALVGNSAYSAATNPGGGAAAGGAGGIGPYGGGGVSYLGQSSVNSGNITTAAGASVLTGGTALTANNGGSNGSNGIGGAVNFASSTNGIAAAAAGGAGGGGGPGGAYGGKGGAGFFRIIWGPDRAYPNTLTMDLVQAGNFTSGVLYKIAKLGTTSQAQWNTLAGTSGSTYAVGTTFTPTSTITGSYGSGTAYRP